MTASIRILTASSLDSDPSLLIVSPDGSQTLVNCGEGCQRSFLESLAATTGPGVGNLRASSVGRVCLTHLGPDATGGLPGMILTTADIAESAAREIMVAESRKGGGGFNGVTGGAKGNGHGNGKGNFNGGGKGNHKRKRSRGDGSLVVSSNGSRNGGEGGGGGVARPPDLELIGPDGISAFVRSLRHFMRRDRFALHCHEGAYDSSINKYGASQEEEVEGRGRRAKKKHGGGRKKKGGGRGGKDGMRFDVRSVPVAYDACEHPHIGSDDPAAASMPLPPIKKHAVSYVFSTPPIPGRFLVDKARELGIPAGRMYGMLKGGESVTFTDPSSGEERTVAPEEVVEKSSPGLGVAVVYCPRESVLEELRGSEAFRAFGGGSNGADEDDGSGRSSDAAGGGVSLDAMVHLTPESVFHTPAYQDWCGGFGPSVDHIALHATETLERRSAAGGDSPFASGMCGGIRRSFLHSGVFPMPLLALSPGGEGGTKDGSEKGNPLPTIEGLPLMDYVLMPRSRRGPNESTMGGLYSPNRVDELRETVGKTGAVEHASSIAASFRALEGNHASGIEKGDSNGNDGGEGLAELIFTGTGSAVPCKHRNVTGMYLRMDNGNSILLDVGEGTVGQLLRSWRSTLQETSSSLKGGPAPIDEYRSRLGGIKAVWISHPHADHHLGLVRLLSERARIVGPDDPIMLMATRDMFEFLYEYGLVVPEIRRGYIAVECRDMLHGRQNPVGQRLFNQLGITYCASIPVAHCRGAYAVVIDGTPFGRVAYSGDCRPSGRLADVARGADLLIHEATFEDGMEEDAVLKRHSTVGEALGVASRMGAAAVVLTHFSQRYPRIPPLRDGVGGAGVDGGTGRRPVAFAFDFMRITPATVGLAAALTPALRLLYPLEPGGGADNAAEGEEEGGKPLSAKEILAVPGVFAAKGVL